MTLFVVFRGYVCCCSRRLYWKVSL